MMWKYIWITLVSMFVVGSVGAAEHAGVMVLNGDITAMKKTAKNLEVTKGRVSASFTPSSDELSQGRLSIDQFNLLLYGVNQSEITGKKPQGHETGTLGFSLSGKQEALTYDPEKRRLTGVLYGNVNIPGYNNPKSTPAETHSKEVIDDFVDPTQKAQLYVVINLNKELTDLVGQSELVSFDGNIQATLQVQKENDHDLSGYEFVVDPGIVIVDWGWWQFEVANNLCVQPVRIGNINIVSYQPLNFSIDYTGNGLPFGKPGAIAQWKKADITFTWKQWTTVWNRDFWEFQESEKTALRAAVSDPECVEVYFVNNFNPQTLWGGGAANASGTANANVISTDENADFGVDLTHLAHEFGHVLSLCHPNQVTCPTRPERNASSTGTLMCGSGFNNDNPQVNSWQNENNVSNPLLTFTIKLASPGQDCTNSADCGACP